MSEKKILDLKVASILDEFSYECLKYECNLIPLDPDHWKETLIGENPDLLLVESAWLGYLGKWKYKIASRSKIKNTLREQLIMECNKMKIPTVFWNKEDPLFFQYFIETAKLFDYVFTTDEGSIEKYKRILGHNNVYVLPFGAQPKLHNPINRGRKKRGKVAFAGTWYKMFPKRERDMEILLKPAIAYNLDIYDRMNKNISRNRYGFPKEYKPYIRDCVSYEEMASIYKAYDVFLNANSVSDSLTMFSRRVFELLACGTNVISSYALGIEKYFQNIVKLSKTEQDTKRYLEILLENNELRDRLSLLGQREVFQKHTYRHRMEKIIEKIGINHKGKDIPGVSIITYTNGTDHMNRVLDNFERQRYEKRELLILFHNNKNDLEKWEHQITPYKNITFFQIDDEISLGSWLNFAIEKAKYDYIAKFNDDNYYGDEFLGDLMDAFVFTDGDIVGKHTYYTYLEGKNMLGVKFPNRENQYVQSLCDGAFIMKKEINKIIKFSDTDEQSITIFFEDCIKIGIILYSTNRFNFVDIIHPWDIEDDEFIKKCEIAMYTKSYINHITV